MICSVTLLQIQPDITIRPHLCYTDMGLITILDLFNFKKDVLSKLHGFSFTATVLRDLSCGKYSHPTIYEVRYYWGQNIQGSLPLGPKCKYYSKVQAPEIFNQMSLIRFPRMYQKI